MCWARPGVARPQDAKGMKFYSLMLARIAWGYVRTGRSLVIGDVSLIQVAKQPKGPARQPVGENKGLMVRMGSQIIVERAGYSEHMISVNGFCYRSV